MSTRRKCWEEKFYVVFFSPSFFTLYPLSTLVLRKIRKVFIVQHQQCYISREEIKLFSPKKKEKKGLFLWFFFPLILHHHLHGYNLTFWLCTNITIQHTRSISLYHHQIVLNVLFPKPSLNPSLFQPELSSAIELFSKLP